MLTEQDAKNGLAKNDRLERMVSDMQCAERDLYNLLRKAIIEGNMFWVPIEYDNTTGLYEMDYTIDDDEKSYYEAYTSTAATAMDKREVPKHFGIYELGEIYKDMIHEDVDYLILITPDAYINIDWYDLQEVMREV